LNIVKLSLSNEIRCHNLLIIIYFQFSKNNLFLPTICAVARFLNHRCQYFIYISLLSKDTYTAFQGTRFYILIRSDQ